MNYPYPDEITVGSTKTLVKSIDYLIKLIQAVYKDKESRPLKERWNIYKEIQGYLDLDLSYMTFDTLDKIREVSWYDDFYLDRHAVLLLDDDFIERATEEFHLTPEQIDSLKEEVIQTGYGAFENDW